MTATEQPSPTPAHPLEPLSAAEMTAAAAIIRSAPEWTESCRFVYLELQEPPKPVVTTWQPGDAWDCQASALLRDRDARTTYEVIASLTNAEVVRWRLIDGVQPPMMMEEFAACDEAVRSDARWQAAMRARGVDDFSLAMIDPWAGGYTGPEDDPGKRRIARPLTFLRASAEDNGYARPIEGLIVISRPTHTGSLRSRMLNSSN